jgi:hypothetical protein
MDADDECTQCGVQVAVNVLIPLLTSLFFCPLLSATHRYSCEESSSSQMAAASPLISASPAWHALESHASSSAIAQAHLRALLQDPARSAALQAEFDGILLDYSRQRVTQDTVNLLFGQSTAESARVHFENASCSTESGQG